jgi:hypothetical protein
VDQQNQDLSDEPRDFMGLKNQEKGDRVLVFLVASAIGLVSLGLLFPTFVDGFSAPSSLGETVLFEVLLSVGILCLLADIWALFRPNWLISILSNTALKTYLVVCAAVIGTAVWLIVETLPK